jgi:hypothetical protein
MDQSTKNRLIAKIPNLVALADNWGRNKAKEDDARMTGDWDGAAMFAQIAETYREQTSKLLKDITNEIRNAEETGIVPVSPKLENLLNQLETDQAHKALEEAYHG